MRDRRPSIAQALTDARGLPAARGRVVAAIARGSGTGWDEELAHSAHVSQKSLRNVPEEITPHLWARGELKRGEHATAPPFFIEQNERWRVWDGFLGDWIDLATAINCGQWVNLRIVYDPDAETFHHFIGGSEVHAIDVPGTRTVAIGESFLNSYNYAYEDIDPAFTNQSYDVHWSSPVAPPPPPPPPFSPCGEDGLQLLGGDNRQLISSNIHKYWEPLLGEAVDPVTEELLDLSAEEAVHDLNCDVVVPVEDAVDDLYFLAP